jgi:hypothetical protein
MGKRTSVYLSDELADAVKASGIPPAELIRRGLDVSPSAQVPEIETMRRALALFGRVVDQLERRAREE